MNSINFSLLNAVSLLFENPLLLLLIIPGVILALFPYFRLKKEKRRTRNRIASMIIHMIILVLACFVLSGFTIHEEDALVKNETIILMDMSDSTESVYEDMAGYVMKVIDDVDESNTVGIVAYGTDSIVYRELSTKADFDANDFYSRTAGGIDRSSTNLANAMIFAAQKFHNASTARLIILSDGLETDGNAYAIAQTMGAQGARIDAVYFEPSEYEDEMQISDVQMNNSALKDKPVAINVTVKSHNEGSATLKAIDIVGSTETVLEQREVEIKAGENTFILEGTFTGEALHTVRVELTNEGDEVLQNNKFYSFVKLVSTDAVLVVYGPNQGDKPTTMETLLKEQGYDVTVKAQAEAPSDLSDFGEVILMNTCLANSDAAKAAGNNSLPAGYDVVIKNYVNAGGGLLTTGGNDTYFNGGMKSSQFNNILPVDVEPDPTGSKAIYFVVDASSGMFDDSYGGSNRATLVKEALRNALTSGVFSDNDYVGLVYFGGKQQPVKALPLTPAYELMDIYNAINAISRMSYTEWSLPLKMAYSEISTFGAAETKHVIFISDGAPNSKITGVSNDAWKGVPQYYYTNKAITTSAISVGTEAMTDGDPAVLRSYMEQIATEGGGRCFHCQSANDILNSVTEECKAVKTDIVTEEGTYEVQIGTYTPVLKNLTNVTLPTITRYNGSTVRVGASTSLQCPSQVGADPIYAQWSYGKGNVGSFMTDLNDWGSSYLTTNEGKTLFTNITNLLFSANVSEVSSDVTLEYIKNNYTTQVVATMASENTEVAKMQATVDSINSNDANQKIPLNIAGSAFTGLFTTNKEGLYSIEYNRAKKDNTLIDSFTDYVTFSYSMEYDTFYDNDKAFRLMSSICSVSNGGKLFDPTLDENIFSKDIMYTTTDYKPQIEFMLSALILFVLDIVVRKFHFLLPKEIIAKIRDARS